ncbi:MAG TPA: YicC/YloC family endoribonuclease [Burkholderiales bacterium]|jgi:uncharacterized protein (TIGR00255 family)
MTGYAAASADSPRGRLSIELRSVNARFLDLQFRVTEELRALEPALRELVTARVSRGKVDCRLFLNASGPASIPQRLNAEALAQLRMLSEEARRAFPDAGPLRLADVLRWPGVIAESAADEEAMRRIATDVCRRALDDLVASRTREGAKLAASILERAAGMRGRVEAVAPLIPQSVAAYQQKMAERLREAIGSGEEERIRAEVALFAAKTDVDEELERLRTHLDEVERVLREGGGRSSSVGKRLDFIAQELNREANTLASKAASPPVADCALELKLLVEQIREQVQNLE